MKISIFETDREGARLRANGSFVMEERRTDVIDSLDHRADVEGQLVNLHPEVTYQTVSGIGGAFSDAAARAFAGLSPAGQEEFLTAYFDRENGIGYNFGRVSIGSCDFSADDYTYVAEGDRTLDSFSVAHDEKDIFPLIRRAAAYSPELSLLASPWSPPAFMKTNGSRLGGKLRQDCYGIWAKHFRLYADACRAAGIPLDYVTLQNEPRHHQLWESCLYTPEEEASLLGEVGRALDGTGVKILCYDHCRERVLERAEYLAGHENGHYCAGIAHHWYSGDHFGELRALAYRYPALISMMSECCTATVTPGNNPQTELSAAEHYAHDMLGCFANGLHSFCDWNLTLDEKNGPYHNREGRGCFAEAPVICNTATGKPEFRLAYYYIGQISRFIRRGSCVIADSVYTTRLETCSFKNPDGSVICVLLNRTDDDIPARLRMGDCFHPMTVKAHSIVTARIEA